jgi:hypothetical protein
MLRQFRKIGHFPLLHEPLEKLRIHTVDAEDNQAMVSLPSVHMAPVHYRQSGSYQQGQAKCPPWLLQRGTPREFL